MRIAGYSAIISFTLLLAGCGSDAPDCMKSAGKVVKEQRTLPLFSWLEFSGNINIVLTSDTSSTITVEAGEHLLKKIKTEVNGKRLLIRNDNSCNWVRSYKDPLNVYIGTGNLTDIFHYSPGMMSSENQVNKDTLIIHLYSNGSINLDMNSQYLGLDMDNLGDFRMRGKAHTMLVTVIGTGQFNSEGMSCQELYVDSKGQGDAFVRADSSIRVDLEGPANVYYSGTPSAVQISSQKGSGALIQK